MDNNSPQEAWNMATATMKRLDRTLTLCSFYSTQNDLSNWLSQILDLRRNLVPFLDEDKLKEVENKLNNLPNKWNMFNKIKPMHYGTIAKTLDELYIILYKCMKDKGLLLPKAVDSRRAVIDM